MKIKTLAIGLLVGLINVSVLAGFEQFTGPLSAMNVWRVADGNKGDYWFFDGWSVPALQSITTDDRTFELKPNINTYADNPGNPEWRNNGGAGPDGNAWMDATTLFELNPLTAAEIGASFTFNVDAFDLDERYTVFGFVKVLDPNNDFQVVVIDTIPITGTESNLIVSLDFSSLSQPLTGMLLQAGWEMQGINANPDTDWGSVTVTATDLVADTGDTTPPNPDPMTFAVAPFAASDQAVSMIATTATDESSVEYYFTCTSGNGNDSGWQSDSTYVDSGLDPNTEYTYTVMARDTSALQNTTAPSAPASATTIPTDTTPPSPNPEIEEAEPSSITVKLTATTVSDDSVVEYYFANTITGIDSGWQRSPVYVDTGLAPSATYAYTVMARDLSAATNMTPVSSEVTVVTWSAQRSAQLVDSLQTYTGDSNQGTTKHDLAIAGWEIASADEMKLVAFDANGAKFGEAATFQNRNTLRTLYEDYGDYDFEMFATFITSNTSEQAGFIGVGQGIVGGFGVPDFQLQGVNAINAEMQGNWCKVFTHTNGVISNVDETTGLSTVTNRVRMVHDATAETITFELDTDYDGETFVADRTLGAASTVGVWVDAPQRVYVAAGAGVTFKDVEVSSAAPGYPVELGVAEVVPGGGLVLTWEGVPGQVYEVQYTSDLVSPSWTVDSTIGEIQDEGGTMSATSTVGVAEAFYRFIEQ